MSFLKKEDVIGKLVIDPEAKIIGTVTGIGMEEEKIVLIVQCEFKTLKKERKPNYARLHAMLLENVKKRGKGLGSPEWELSKEISRTLNVDFPSALMNENLIRYAQAINFEIPLLETEKEAKVEVKVPWNAVATLRDVVLTKTPIELPSLPTPTIEQKPIICPVCGYQNPSYAINFCIKCGAKLG